MHESVTHIVFFLALLISSCSLGRLATLATDGFDVNTGNSPIGAVEPLPASCKLKLQYFRLPHCWSGAGTLDLGRIPHPVCVALGFSNVPIGPGARNARVQAHPRR